MKFANELKRLRLLHNMTQAELAEALGVKRSTIGMYENSNREPDFEMIEKIADYFNVCIASLMEDAPAADPAPLPSDEQQLLAGYRKLDDVDKQNALNMLDAFLKNDKYKEESAAASA